MNSPKILGLGFFATILLAATAHAERVLEYSLSGAVQRPDVRLEAIHRAAIMRGWTLAKRSQDDFVLEITTEFRQRYAKISVRLIDDRMIVTLLDQKNLGKRKVSKDFDRWIKILHADTLAWLEYINPGEGG